MRQIAAAATLSLVLTVSPARAADTVVDTSVEARTSVNDNSQLTSLPHPTVFILALTPTLSLSQVSESSKLDVTASSTTYEVGHQQDDNHTDLHLSTGYTFGDATNTYALKGSFVRDLTIESELASTGVLLSRQGRKELSLDPAWTHNFSERFLTQLSFEADDVHYDGDFLTTGLSNYHYYVVPLAATYQMTERDSLSLVLSPSLYRADQEQSSTQTTQVDLSWEHKLSERARVTLDVGEFHARTKIQRDLQVCPGSIDFCILGLLPFVTLHSKTDTVLVGPVFQGGLDYQVTEADKAAIHFSRSLSPSGSGTLLLIESVDGSIGRSINPETEFNFGLTETRTSFLGTSGGFISDYRTAFADVAFKLAPTSRLETGIRAIRARNGSSGPLIRGDEAYILYHYDWPQKSLVH